jgi:hypothetical protein
MTTILDKEIQFFEKMKPQLMEHHFGKFVVIHNKQLVGTYDSFNKAAEEALRQFGKGPYLIRQVIGNDPIKIPASVAYRVIQAHASN